MKIGVQTPGVDKPAVLESGERMYFDFDSQAGVRVRHAGQLVLQNGWLNLDYDASGYLIGLEVVQGDPAVLQIAPPDYLQPLNPLEKKSNPEG